MPEPPITPMPVPPSAATAILIGGTFDPPHRAHVELPIRARDVLEKRAGRGGAGRGGAGAAWLVYIPAARSPHKGAGPVASDADRIQMLKLALEGVPRAGVWTDEIDRAATAPSQPSYTVDTVRRARTWLDAQRSTTQLRFLIGADQALAFHRWREPAAIIAAAEPAVMLRPPVATREALLQGMRDTKAWDETAIAHWDSRLVDVGVIDAAATSARTLLATTPRDAKALSAILNDRVRDYILARDLYTPPAP